MLEQVVSAVAAALRTAGLSTGPAYPREAVAPENGAFVRVGVAKASDRDAGLARYLGVETDPEAGEREVYGLRCALELSLDVYAPPDAENAAMECLSVFDRAAAQIGGTGGLRVREITCGAPEPDPVTGMFVLRGAVRCDGLLAASSGDGGAEAEFTDFVLRGVLKNT